MPHSVVDIEGPDWHEAYVLAMRRLCVHEGEETWGLVTGDVFGWPFQCPASVASDLGVRVCLEAAVCA